VEQNVTTSLKSEEDGKKLYQFINGNARKILPEAVYISTVFKQQARNAK